MKLIKKSLFLNRPKLLMNISVYLVFSLFNVACDRCDPQFTKFSSEAQDALSKVDHQVKYDIMRYADASLSAEQIKEIDLLYKERIIYENDKRKFFKNNYSAEQIRAMRKIEKNAAFSALLKESDNNVSVKSIENIAEGIDEDTLDQTILGPTNKNAIDFVVREFVKGRSLSKNKVREMILNLNVLDNLNFIIGIKNYEDMPDGAFQHLISKLPYTNGSWLDQNKIKNLQKYISDAIADKSATEIKVKKYAEEIEKRMGDMSRKIY